MKRSKFRKGKKKRERCTDTEKYEKRRKNMSRRKYTT